MTTLTEFLLARIAEDESVAGQVASPIITGGKTGTSQGRYRAKYVSHFDPARVLAECEAKRRIVGLHHPLDGGSPESYPFASEITGKLLYAECNECGHGGEPYCPTLQLLALPYADHEQFREEWRV